jgi:glycosyltransferase involved in cell wall biosynthesis
MMHPLISVVIPTRNRPELMLRAVLSALAQTLTEIEVIVVIDGPDPATVSVLSKIVDCRFRWIELPVSGGACAARNHAIREAHAPWIALLDDDDAWFPTKLERQLRVAESQSVPYPIVACQVAVDRGITEAIWPERQPRDMEHLSEYVFCRSGLGFGETLITTSMLLAPSALFHLVPFSTAVRRHQDTDWILRATKVLGAKLVWAWEPLSLFNLDVAQSSIGRSGDPAPSRMWAEGNALLTPKAYAYFVATQIAPRSQHVSLQSKFSVLRQTRGYPRALLLSMLFLFTTSMARQRILSILPGGDSQLLEQIKEASAVVA